MRSRLVCCRLHVQVEPFKWRYYEAKYHPLLRWYCSYPLSYRQVAEIVNERIQINDGVLLGTAVARIQTSAAVLILRPTNDS